VSGNPAREIEAFAATVISRWVGEQGHVEHTGAGTGAGPDFRIEYQDGRVAIGEVGWDVDQRLAEMWSLMLAQDEHHVIRLRPGSGLWSLSLRPGAPIKQLLRDVPALVDGLLELGVTNMSPEAEWAPSELVARAMTLGIQRIELTSTEAPEGGDRAYYFFGSSGSFVPDDPDVIVDWLDGYLANPRYADTCDKLLPLEADERHIFVLAGSGAPPEASMFMLDLRGRAPSRAPKLLKGITHAWAAAEWGRGDVALWTLPDGWSIVAAPDGEAR
jgi:hypothetical protein